MSTLAHGFRTTSLPSMSIALFGRKPRDGFAQPEKHAVIRVQADNTMSLDGVNERKCCRCWARWLDHHKKGYHLRVVGTLNEGLLGNDWRG